MKRIVSMSSGDMQQLYGNFECIELIKKAGADVIDFSLAHYDVENHNTIYAKGEDATAEYFTKLRRHADSLGVTFGQTHGRARGFAQSTQEYNEVIYPQNAKLDCLATSILGAPVSVFHPCNIIRNGVDCPKEDMRKMNFDMFCKAVELAKPYGVKISNETVGTCIQVGHALDFCGDLREMLALQNKVSAVGDNAAYFTLCMDTGHSNMAVKAGQPSVGDAIRILGKNITILHIHDNDGINDRHQIPKVGNINWEDVLSALDEIGYTGTYNLETDNFYFGKRLAYETCEMAIKALKNMLYERYGE